jgi:hypothetical protein
MPTSAHHPTAGMHLRVVLQMMIEAAPAQLQQILG